MEGVTFEALVKEVEEVERKGLISHINPALLNVHTRFTVDFTPSEYDEWDIVRIRHFIARIEKVLRIKKILSGIEDKEVVTSVIERVVTEPSPPTPKPVDKSVSTPQPPQTPPTHTPQQQVSEEKVVDVTHTLIPHSLSEVTPVLERLVEKEWAEIERIENVSGSKQELEQQLEDSVRALLEESDEDKRNALKIKINTLTHVLSSLKHGKKEDVAEVYGKAELSVVKSTLLNMWKKAVSSALSNYHQALERVKGEEKHELKKVLEQDLDNIKNRVVSLAEHYRDVLHEKVKEREKLARRKGKPVKFSALKRKITVELSKVKRLLADKTDELKRADAEEFKTHAKKINEMSLDEVEDGK